MAQPKFRKQIIPSGAVMGWDPVNQEWTAIYVDVDGTLRVGTSIDLSADIEIDGTQVTNRHFTPASSGDNTIVSIGASNRVKIYKALLTPSADITGKVVLKLGTTEIGGVQNPKSGGQYVLVSCFPDYEYGALDEDIVVNLPSATEVSINISYEVI